MISETSTAAGRPTLFLPAERAAHAEVLRQHALLTSDPLVRDLLNSSIGLSLILNAQRQVVFINEPFRARLKLNDAFDVVGSRPGEAFGCLRAMQPPNGCGTTKACRDCGAARAIASAQSGRASVQTCRIRTVVCGQDLSLMLRAAPFSYKGESFVLISASDNAHELRRRELEKIFFHDVLNTAGGVQGLLLMMQESGEGASFRDYLTMARKASDTLVEELLSQRDVAAAENGELKVSRTEFPARVLLAELVDMFAVHPLAKDRKIELGSGSEDILLTADSTLLSRVLVNLIKNALEAVAPGQTVTASCRSEGGFAVFLVHNPGYMPEAVQHQMFQRSFSTKGVGRGLGTYSVRLLTENYLGGSVGFTSDPERGTTFRAEYPLKPAPLH